MKKILLMMVAFVATFSAFAEDKDEDFWGGWDDSFKPVAADKTPTPVIAQAGDGSVYVAVQRGVEFTFAGKAVPAPEIDGSGVIVKYDKDGKEQWAVTLDGAATVRALAADKDGTLYATGSFLDEVDYTGTNAVKGTIKSFGAVSAFVAKVSKDGKFEEVKTFEPTGNLEVVLSEFPFYLPDEDPIDITPNNIQIDGDKVYVSATYKGDVADFDWKGAYLVNYDFGMYMDNASAGVFSLNKSDLSGAANVAYVQATGTISETQNYPEAINFVADNGTVYVGFFGFGNMTITTPAGTKDFTFASDGEGGNEHGFVLATVGSALTTKVFNAAKHDKVAKPYKVEMGVAGENIIVGGTFYGELPFANAKTSGDFASDAFAASIKKDGTVNWTNVCAKESKATVLLVTGEEVHLGTTIGNFTIKAATGEMEADEKDGEEVIAISDASGWGDEYAAVVLAEKNEVCVISKDMNSEEELEEGLVEIPQSQGTEYDDFKRATLEEGDKYNTYTVTEDLQIAIKMMDVDVKDCDYVVVKFAEPVAAGWRLAFWSNTDLTEVPEGAKEYKYVFADDPKCGVTDGVLPQICMMTFFGGFTPPLEAKVVGIYKHMITPDDIDAPEAAPAVANDGQLFNLLGQPVDENYKGVAITADGKKVYLR